MILTILCYMAIGLGQTKGKKKVLSLSFCLFWDFCPTQEFFTHIASEGLQIFFTT